MRHRAFTLIELLIAVSIGMLLVASVWGVFGQVMQATRRNQAVTSLHLEASAIHQAIDQAMSTMFHGAAVHLVHQARGGSVEDAGIDLDFMSSDRVWHRLSFRTGSGGIGPPRLTLASEGEWFRIKGTLPKNYSYPAGSYGFYGGKVLDPGAPDGGSYILWSDQEDYQAKPATPANSADRKVYLNMWLVPEVRRDRRRAMDDNDLRLLRNAPKDFYDTLNAWDGRPIGDGSRLAAGPKLLSTKVSRFRLELVDARGYRTVACATPDAYGPSGIPIGISYYDADGAALSPPSPASSISSPNFVNVWTGARRSVDGIWSDGRNAPCSLAGGEDPLYTDYDGNRLPPPALERPLLVRVAFTLNQPETSLPIPKIAELDGSYYDGIEFDKRRPHGNAYVSRDFTFTFASAPLTPRL